jgi:head-tail adaptor
MQQSAMPAGARQYPIAFIRATATADDYNQPVEAWASPTTLVTMAAMVTFGSAQEKREAAQQAAEQTASFQCLRTPTLEGVTAKDRISFDGSQWGITERAPLDRRMIRFTAIRIL